MHINHHSPLSALALLAALAGGAALAQSDDAPRADTAARPAQRATERVTDAMRVVRQLEAEPRMKQLLQQAKGVLIVPAYGRAALGV
ncbi:hypothetical protein GTP56_29480, partial [Duganella sp. FT134W]|nr:hypothetical protein [Duganella margarita]